MQAETKPEPKMSYWMKKLGQLQLPVLEEEMICASFDKTIPSVIGTSWESHILNMVPKPPIVIALDYVNTFIQGKLDWLGNPMSRDSLLKLKEHLLRGGLSWPPLN